jgi:DNA-binding PadR family transcriptional regulator
MRGFWGRRSCFGGRGWAYANAPYGAAPAEEFAGCGSRPRTGFAGPFMNRGFWHWAGGPWGARSRFFEGGEVRLAILSLLAEGPKHGYQLMKELKDRSGGMYRASAGTVYPTLQLLEDEGLIELDQQQTRRVYQITEAGRAELAKDAETVHRIWERAENWEDWSQYAGPEILAFASPLGTVLKSLAKAAKWASGSEEREAKVREMLKRVSSDLDELRKPKE